MDDENTSYFRLARNWSDDIYTRMIVSRNRYQCAFFLTLLLACLLTVALIILMPLQHLEPLLIHHYPSGRITVQSVKTPYAPDNPAQVESDLVRYVVNRESYDASSYATQYTLIHLLSSRAVAKEYHKRQSPDNPLSPIHMLGTKKWRTVHVESVVFLDSQRKNTNQPKIKQNHHNLAEINFTISDQTKTSREDEIIALTALVSWVYRGTPTDPENRWRNWNGFTVTRYTVSQRNV